MNWPTSAEYSEAVQNLATTAGDEELRGGQPARNLLGLPLVWSGGFARVFRVECPKTGNTWALKCFVKEAGDRQRRYREIAAHLRQAELPFTVDFDYLDRGLRIRGEWFPAVKMQWIEGLTLNRFVEESLDKPKTLKQLLGMWPKLVGLLREKQIAHADIQHGNVLLVPMPKGQLALRLIDYDGMHVPALAGVLSGELGHASYQHPQRAKKNLYNEHVDRFPHLVIDATLRCLIAGRRELWQRLNNNDNDALLFRKADFENPAGSEVFHTLWRLPDPQARAMVGRLALACQQPLEQTPWLDEVVVNGHALPLSHFEESRVEALMTGNKPAVLRPVVVPARGATEQPAWLSSPTLPFEPLTVDARALVGQSTLPATPSPSIPRSLAERLPRPKEISIDLGNEVKLEMVLIPAGSFRMGSNDDNDEKPIHIVRISKPFYLGKYEVTQEQWQAVMGNNPSNFKGAKNPVEEVTWDDCQTFLEKLNAKIGTQGGKFLLPTEAQWEYACRAGGTGKFCFGDEENQLGAYAWYDANSAKKTHPVGEKKPNAWGLYDMHGNVWEWCADWYDSSYYGKSPVDDPSGPATGSYRVYRGGSWNFGAWSCRSADRLNYRPGFRLINLGLRVSYRADRHDSARHTLAAPAMATVISVKVRTLDSKVGREN